MRRSSGMQSTIRRAVSLTLNVPYGTVPAAAAASLTIEPITWNVIGLDSNDVTSGPNQFLVGARICNTGAAVIAVTHDPLVSQYAHRQVNCNDGLVTRDPGFA